MNKVHGRQELPRNSRVGKFLRNSGRCLNIKKQVGVLLGEHRGWILRMATLIKGRLSDNRPEACQLSFRLKELRTFVCFPTKRQVRDTRYEKDAEDLYKGYI